MASNMSSSGNLWVGEQGSGQIGKSAVRQLSDQAKGQTGGQAAGGWAGRWAGGMKTTCLHILHIHEFIDEISS